MAYTLHPLYAKITNNLYIGNYDAFEDLVHHLETGIDKPPLTDVTCVINLSSTRPRNRPSRDLLNYIERVQSGDEPVENSFANVANSMINVINVSLRPSIQNGNVVMLVCETGRRQSAMIAVLYQLVRGANSEKIYNDMVFAHMTSAQRERYLRIEAELASHKFDEVDTEDPEYKAYEMNKEDKEFYSNMKTNFVCLSPKYKNFLQYHLSPPAEK